MKKTKKNLNSRFMIHNSIRKVLILGSGALKIGQAGEFDYSGSQAIKALKEEGIKTVLVNPNIATIQTSEFLADTVYFLPIESVFVEKIIAKEKPDSILLSFGGQTALNCGIDLYKKGIFKKYNITVLGTPTQTIILTEDRRKFSDHLAKLQIPTPVSHDTYSIEEARKRAQEIGYPVMIRAGYSLGGQKSGVARNREELEKILETTFAFSKQALIEKYLHHYKEIEYEVVRDKYDNCVTVCNMENMDPLGIHTGESIVVAPSQTLTNTEYHYLRKISIDIVRSLGIVGECNVQFALNPNPKKYELDFYVIEVNARLSRSSALASKATGYPLAYVAAKLGLGYGLTEIKNQVTKVTQSCFEPALDYIVVKIPRWDLEKFHGVRQQIGSSMKSVGEVMGIGRTFEEALQKAIRMLDSGFEGVLESFFPKDHETFMYYIKTPTRKRAFAIAEALKRGLSRKEIHDYTGIDLWFIDRIKNIVDAESLFIKKNKIDKELLLHVKQLGFSDRYLSRIKGKKDFNFIRDLRKKWNIIPSVFQIDTLAGEFPSKTNYLYCTYNGSHNDVHPLGKQAVMVLGSGPYHIGSSVEFDWTCVNTAISLKKHGKKSIIINSNPETVSTDYDISDRLYFEELTIERILDIWEFEQSYGAVVSVGGQKPNRIAGRLQKAGVKVLGTKVSDIERAENRNKFSALLDKEGIAQPVWAQFKTIDGAKRFAKSVGYPVLIRPSYVLSGSAMSVSYTEQDLTTFVKGEAIVNNKYPITVSKFMEEAKEIEVDGVAQNGNIMVFVIAEHIEHAGVHSGDATIVYPPYETYLQTERQIIDITKKIAKALHITGPFNIQFLAKENKVAVIEINLRASRTLPFVSKATGVNFASVIVDAFFHKAKRIKIRYPDYIVVKAPQFSFSRLEGADPILRVEMSSTGEAASFGKTKEEAYLKAQLSVGEVYPRRGVFLSLGGLDHKVRFLDSALRLKNLGLHLYATANTAKFLQRNGIKTKRLYKIHEGKQPNVLTFFQNGRIDFAINITDPNYKKDINDDYIIRRAAIDHNIHLITNRQKAALFIKAISELPQDELEIKAWNEYV